MLLPYILRLIEMFILFVILSVVGRTSEMGIGTKEPSKVLIGISVFMISLIASFQFASFPLSKTFFETDQTVFQYIGARMHEGLVPYKDLFDHKGIILYFIQYISLLIPQHSIGLWLVELINIFLFSIFIYKIADLYVDSFFIKLITVISVTCISGYFAFDGGNLSETYAITWITIALYYFLSFIENESFKKLDIILIGISFSIVFFLRQNMIGVWMFFIPCVTVLLIKKKNFSDLFKCMGLFITGCCIVMLPLLVYFFKTDSFKPMIDYYFIFNFAYSGSVSNIGRLYAAFVLVFCAGLAVPVLGLSLLFCKNKKKSYFYNIVFFVISLGLASLSALTYSHYAMLLLPAIIIPVVYSVQFIYSILDKLSSKKIKLSKGIATVLSMVSMVLVIVFILNSSSTSLMKDLPKTVNYINENTEKKDDVIVIGNECYNYFYTGRKTANKFFYQTPPIYVSEKIANEFLDELMSKPSDYIIAYGERRENKYNDSVEGKVFKYLESQCNIGKYVAEDHDGFFVYKKVK